MSVAPRNAWLVELQKAKVSSAVGLDRAASHAFGPLEVARDVGARGGEGQRERQRERIVQLGDERLEPLLDVVLVAGEVVDVGGEGPAEHPLLALDPEEVVRGPGQRGRLGASIELVGRLRDPPHVPVVDAASLVGHHAQLRVVVVPPGVVEQVGHLPAPVVQAGGVEPGPLDEPEVEQQPLLPQPAGEVLATHEERIVDGARIAAQRAGPRPGP